MGLIDPYMNVNVMCIAHIILYIEGTLYSHFKIRNRICHVRQTWFSSNNLQNLGQTKLCRLCRESSNIQCIRESSWVIMLTRNDHNDSSKECPCTWLLYLRRTSLHWTSSWTRICRAYLTHLVSVCNFTFLWYTSGLCLYIVESTIDNTIDCILRHVAPYI